MSNKWNSTTWKEKEFRAAQTRKQKESGSLYSSDDRRAKGLAALNKYIDKQIWKKRK